jgi:hypothetical protein
LSCRPRGFRGCHCGGLASGRVACFSRWGISFAFNLLKTILFG